MGSVFKVDRVTNIGSVIADDEKSENISIEYRRGPPKLLKRAKAKTENDYFAESYPTSASVLDLNRCSLIFGDIQSLLKGLDYFVNAVYGYAAGTIIGIVRSKNGFKEYVVNAGYADIKLNVLIRGDKYNMVGEVQFLLATMTAFKQRAHNLYSIERELEFMDESVSKILPSLIDQENQLKVRSAAANAKGLCALMVFGNKKISNLLIGNDRPILRPICKKGGIKALKLILSLMREQKIS